MIKRKIGIAATKDTHNPKVRHRALMKDTTATIWVSAENKTC